MSVTSSPEPMELDPTPAASILPSDITVDWPIEEDQELIFSLRMNVSEREPTRTKVLGLATQDHLTVGENIRQHPSYSDEDGLYLAKSIKSHQVQSSHLCNAKNLSLFAPPNPPHDSTDYTTHKATDHLPPSTQPSRDLPRETDIDQNRTHPSYSNDADHLFSHSDPKSPAPESNSVAQRVSQEVSADSGHCDTASKTPLDCGACETDKRVSSPVFMNGSQHHNEPPSNPHALLSHQKERFIETQSLDTPPLSSSTPEESTTEPFHGSPPFHEGNGSSVSQPQENEKNLPEACSQDVLEEHLSKQILSEVSEKEIENKNPNYDLETPPADDAPVPALHIASPPKDSDEEKTIPSGSGIDTCPGGEVEETPESDLPLDSTGAEAASSDRSVVDSENFEKEVISNELLTPTLVAEVETFSTSRAEDNPEKADDPLPISLPSTLKESIYHPPIDTKTRLYMKKCGDIIDIQRVLQEKSRELQTVIGQMEKKFLIQQSSTFLTFASDKNQPQPSSESSHSHSHLLKRTHNRELEKQARFYRAALKKCEDNMQTGFETASSSEDECYMNSTNLGGPKRRRLTKQHRNWLNDRVEIGARWNWLDVQISQIEAEISSVNQRLEELNASRVPDQEHVTTDTSSRCIPYAPTPSPSRVIHKTISHKADSMTNILQSSPHYHPILSLQDNIPSTLLLHDSLMTIRTKDLPFDSKDLKKLEQTISHNKSASIAQCPIRKVVNSTYKQIGHRPKLNSRSSFVHRFGSVSVAEMSRNKAGKNKPLLSGAPRHRRARSYDTTSITIPGSSLPRQEKPSFKEIVIPGWREFTPCEEPSSLEDNDYEECSDLTYETLHSKHEQAEKQNYFDAMHLSSASSKKLKRLLISPDSPKVYTASYGWDTRRFPLTSDGYDLEMPTPQSSRTTESTSPIEDAVFSTPQVTSHITNAQ